MSGPSPYAAAPKSEWATITDALVAGHPLFGQTDVLLSAVDMAWHAVWATEVGQAPHKVPLRDIAPRAQIVGEFLETLLSVVLAKSNAWKRGGSKEKDFLFLGETKQEVSSDFELKTSGQRSGKIFGNRSYAQDTADATPRKDRAGYYLCINFFQDKLCQVRVGWIDASDWVGQKSQTGQMASLKDEVYHHKLLTVFGPYAIQAPLVSVGVSEDPEAILQQAAICSTGDLARCLRNRGIEHVNPGCVAGIAKVLTEAGLSKAQGTRVAKLLTGSVYFQYVWTMVSHNI